MTLEETEVWWKDKMLTCNALWELEDSEEWSSSLGEDVLKKKEKKE